MWAFSNDADMNHPLVIVSTVRSVTQQCITYDAPGKNLGLSHNFPFKAHYAFTRSCLCSNVFYHPLTTMSNCRDTHNFIKISSNLKWKRHWKTQIFWVEFFHTLEFLCKFCLTKSNMLTPVVFILSINIINNNSEFTYMIH